MRSGFRFDVAIPLLHSWERMICVPFMFFSIGMKKILRSIIGLLTTVVSASAIGTVLYSPEVMSTPN
jgi:hypothetical protein